MHGGVVVQGVIGILGYILFENNIVENNIYNTNGGVGQGGIYIWGSQDWTGEIVFKKFTSRKCFKCINTIYGFGGGIYIENCSPKIYNNIIRENTYIRYGGGIDVSWWSGWRIQILY